MPNKEALFCVFLVQTAIGLTGLSPAFDGTTILPVLCSLTDYDGPEQHGYERCHGLVEISIASGEDYAKLFPAIEGLTVMYFHAKDVLLHLCYAFSSEIGSVFRIRELWQEIRWSLSMVSRLYLDG